MRSHPSVAAVFGRQAATGVYIGKAENLIGRYVYFSHFLGKRNQVDQGEASLVSKDKSTDGGASVGTALHLDFIVRYSWIRPFVRRGRFVWFWKYSILWVQGDF